MPKKRKAPPPDPKYLKFRFHVPFIIPVTVGSQTIGMAREKVTGMVKHGDFVYNLDLSAASPHKGSPDKWPVELAWSCPQCGKEEWFFLGHENTCKGWCNVCQKYYVVVEGYIYRNVKEGGGCESCSERIECMLIPRANPVLVSEEDTL